jgi:AraC-like DNA-binding protein
MTKSARKSRTLTWPRQIPRAKRQPLYVRHGSFFLRRIHLGEDAFNRQRIRLAGHLLVVVRQGAAILERDGCETLLQEGDACLIPPSQFQMTEIPRPHVSRGEILLCFFTDRAIADLLAGKEGMDEAARIALPALPFYPVRGFIATASESLQSPTDFGGVFARLLNAGGGMPFAFLKRVYFTRRVKLCLFLEDHCRGWTTKAIEQQYPDGIRAFRRECSIYLGMPVDQWLFRRRMELAHAWLRYSNRTEYEVAAALG